MVRINNRVILLFLLLFVNSAVKSQWYSSKICDNYISDIISYNGVLFLTSLGDGIFISMNGGKSWITYNQGISDLKILDILEYKNKIFASSGNGNVYTLSYPDVNWSSSNYNYPQGGILRSDNTGIMIAAGGRIYKSYDLGVNWTFSSSFMGGFVSFIITDFGYIAGSANAGVYLSNDTGSTWKPINNGIPKIISYSPIIDLKLFNSTLFAATDIGLYYSDNEGTKWDSINCILSNKIIYKLEEYKSYMFAGTDDGIYVSNDSGKNWGNINDTSDITYVTTIAFNDSFIYVGNGEGKLWKRKLSEVINGIKPSPIFDGIKIYQTIDNFLMITSDLTLNQKNEYNVFDLFGRCLHSGDLLDISNKISINDLKTGIYIISIKSGELLYRKKILITN